jgi:asparagine synthase (glutamine-hydrolysing)
MLESVRHEPFYKTGTEVDEALGVYIGWTVLENSFASEAPFRNESGDVTLVFSGEEYPEPGMSLALKKRGHSLSPEGASYLAHLCEEDQNFPCGLNGIFHGLIVDRRSGTATLFNDRFGMHRVYYHESKEAFYFAAEAKAILAVRSELRELDPRGFGEFVALSCVLENRTLFKSIHVLPSGSAWVFRCGSIEEKRTYFEPGEWEQQTPLDSESYYRGLRDAISANLARYFAGQQRTAMALTGGMDTRVIMAWQKLPAGALPCYTFGGMRRDCEDVVVARKVAELCGQPHQVISVGGEFLRRFAHYAERTVYLTEGGVDVYRSSDLYVSEQARQIAPVKVVGTYGSEILRHAVMFKPARLLHGMLSADLAPSVDEAKQTYAHVRRDDPVTFAAFRQSPWYHHGILSLEQTQLSVRSPYLDNAFVRAVYRAPKAGDLGNDLRLRLIADGSPALRRLRTDRGVGGRSGLSSVLARCFLEFTFKAEYGYDYGMPQWVARIDHSLAPLHLDRLFLGRHKFSHYRVWYRDILSAYVRQVLLDPLTLSRPYLNRRAVEAIVEGHTKGKQNYTTEIHKLLTLELLQRLFFDSGSSLMQHESRFCDVAK